MKKSLVAVVLTIGLVGNAFASCDTTPYVSPEELQPACAEEAPAVQGADSTPADKPKVTGEGDSKNDRNADSTEKHAVEKSSQSRGK